MWKKIGIAVLVLVLLAGVSTGIYFIVKNEKAPTGEYNHMQYLEDEYVVGEKIVFNFVSQSDSAYTAMKYTINSGDEIAVETQKGETKNDAKLDAKNGEYYISSGTQTIETTELKAGTHVLTFYVYHDTTRVIAYEHVFKIVDPA